MTSTIVDEAFLAVLRSPENGRELRVHSPGVLSDGESLWPCVDGVAYLRHGRDALRRAAVAALRCGDGNEALALLLTDRRDASIPPVSTGEARHVVANAHAAPAVLDGLRYGGLAWYLQHRSTQPTFLSGLALLEAHALSGAVLFDLACGTGQYLRAWQQANPGGAAIGADVVFSHLWIARRFVSPSAWLVCFDADGPFPLADGAAGSSMAQDAFHYFTRKAHVLQELRRVTGTGPVVLGHVHNAAQFNFSPGLPWELDDYLSAIDPAAVYADDALTRAALGDTNLEGTSPLAALASSPALAFATAAAVTNRVQLTLPPAGTALTLNPLLAAGQPQWPSDRFVAEFVDSWEYLKTMAVPNVSVVDRAMCGALGTDSDVDRCARRRVLLDVPGGWL
jgi:SAM-dependent methyltransferase